jgi:CheY-like chemotaxis protein
LPIKWVECRRPVPRLLQARLRTRLKDKFVAQALHSLVTMTKYSDSEALFAAFPHSLKNNGAIKTVLLVEDDPDIRDIMQVALEEEGYRVKTAEIGKVGFEILIKYPRPSLVLLDMRMPVMDGRQFLDLVKLDESLTNVPIVVVSANADTSNSKGASAIMQKPTSLSKLLNLVSNYCHATQFRTKRVLQ